MKTIEMFNDTMKNNGGTYSITGKKADKGFMVAKEQGAILDLKDFTAESLQEFINQNDKVFKENDNAFIGTWIANGKAYLDISYNIVDKDQAIKVGKQYNQLAIFDLNTMTEINL